MNKRHWNTVLLDGSLPTELVQRLFADSYALVRASLPLATRQALGL
jgi:predicted DNA-binding protein (MmcQ/YjbR family)